MNLIIFSEGEATRQEVVTAVRVAGVNGPVEVYPTCETFHQRLRGPKLLGALIIIALQQRRTLETLIREKELVRDIRTIVVPPDDDMETIVRAHLLRPRFVIFKEDIAEKLPKVLTKMDDTRH
ncbi:MAG: hypothetical protein V2B19_00440 [Pseudomonadota bacterium]